MGSIFTQLFESDLLTFLIIFVAIPYLYLSLATEVQRDCADVIRQNMMDRQKLKPLASYLDEISYIFNAEWWLIAAVALLLICLFYGGAFLANSALFCTPARPSLFQLPCGGAHEDSVTFMKTIFMIYTVLVGLGLLFRIWWARIAVAKEIRDLYADLGDGAPKLLAWELVEAGKQANLIQKRKE
jgi:hypothetical protein